MKKIMSMLLLLLITTAFVSCDNNTSENDNHVHSFTAWIITKEASCTEQGVKTRHCSLCGFVEQDSIAIISHTVVIDDAVDSTCITEGKTVGAHCSVCNTVIVAQTAIFSKGHIEVVDSVINPTCTTEGKTEGRHCSVCNTVIVAQTTVSAKGHIEATDFAVAPTCTTEGKTEGKHCTLCKAVIVKQNTIPAIKHNYDKGTVISPASCIQEGVIKYTCTASNCGHSYTDSYSLAAYTATEINKQALCYVGEIITYDKSGSEQSLGTGFVYSTDGKIITNYHVIDEAHSAKITINGVSYTIASVLAYDVNIDLAVLKINADGLTCANVCKAPVQVGEIVYAIGSPRGFTNTFSQGIITYADRVVGSVSYIQHDASITHGNSGGPLINRYGEVIGINSWGRADSQNLNFAVFTDELDNLVYGTPKTLAELYEQKHNYEYTLKSHLIENGTYDSFSYWYRVRIVNEFSESTRYFSIVYDAEDDGIFVSLTSFFDNGDQAYFYLSLDPYSDGTLYYGASYRNKANGTADYTDLNNTYGLINPAEFYSYTTTLPYTEIESTDNDTGGWLEYHSERLKILLNCLSEYFVNNNLNITLSNYGFVNYN